MESITMTNATQISRVHDASPQANAIRLAVTRGWTQGTTVSAFLADARGDVAVQAVPAYLVGGFRARTPKTMDVVYLRSGEPPV
jgi:hypothetical protein